MIWSYTTRTLTVHVFPFTNPASPVDLSNVRVALQSDPLNIIRDAILTDATRFAGADIALIRLQTDRLAIPEGQTAWAALGLIDDRVLDILNILTESEGAPDGILWKTGGAFCPSGKSIWSALGDGTVSLNDLSNLLSSGTYGLSALKVLIDAIEGKLDNATYGLSALNTDLDALLTRLTAARAGYLDNLSAGAVALESGGNLAAVKTDVDNIQVPIKFTSGIAQDNVSTTNATGTTEKEITVALPSGASRVSAMLAVFVTAKNGAATAQDIDISVSGRPSGGSWVTLISTLTDCLGLPNVDKATTGDAYTVDATTLITGAGTWGFKVTITLSSAATVRFKTQYLLIVTYKMS